MFVNNKDIYLISCNTLKNKSLINKNVDDTYIQAAIKAAEDIDLVEVLGRELVFKLCSMVEDNTISGNTYYQTLLREYVADYLIFKTLAEVQIPLWAKTRNEGIVNGSGTEFTQLSRNDVNFTKDYYDQLAAGLVPRMKEWLDANQSHIAEYKPWRDAKPDYNAGIVL